MDQLELEGIADWAYRTAGVDSCSPSVVRVARGLLGPNAIERGPRLVRGNAALIRVGEDWRIVLSRSLPKEYALHAVGHELGHWLLAKHGFSGDDEERAADFLAGALLAPRATFVRAHRDLGTDLPALARSFSTTETGAALRLGEVFNIPLAVISPALVRVRGPEEWAWPDEPTLRRWARTRPLHGVRKTKLTDDPRRIVLDASAVEETG